MMMVVVVSCWILLPKPSEMKGNEGTRGCWCLVFPRKVPLPLSSKKSLLMFVVAQ